MKLRLPKAAWLLFAALLGGCSVVPVADDPPEIESSPWAVQSMSSAAPAPVSRPASSWHHFTFPGKSPTKFSYTRKDGRDAVAVMAASSVSMLRSKVRIEPTELGSVNFSWKVPQLIEGADLGLRDGDDSPVRVVLVFEGDRSRFSSRDAMLSELARTLTGEPMPYATLMYVWCNHREPGALIRSPRTGRVRTLVVESGAKNLNQWLDYERNIRADYERAFGEPPGALLGIGIMSDSDNTRSTARAWYGPVRLSASTLPR